MIMKPLAKLLALGLLMSATTLALTANADDQAKPYALENCIVSDEKLGEHGKPYIFAHEGQEIKLCCKSCLKDFNKEPATYLKKLGKK